VRERGGGRRGLQRQRRRRGWWQQRQRHGGGLPLEQQREQSRHFGAAPNDREATLVMRAA